MSTTPLPEAGASGEPPPACSYCGQPARLVTGETIYPHLPRLADLHFWRCEPCDAYVGTHPGTRIPLGILANAELRRARKILHGQRLDPIWKNAPNCGAYEYDAGDERALKVIRASARRRVYAYLGHKLGLTIDETHAGMFTIEQCRAAWVALKGVTYADVRAWWKEQHGAAEEPRRQHEPRAAPPPTGGPARKRPCPCGSGKKYKKCCAPDAVAARATDAERGLPRAGSAPGEQPHDLARECAPAVEDREGRQQHAAVDAGQRTADDRERDVLAASEHHAKGVA